jgi:Predicted ATP-dependent serine protease
MSKRASRAKTAYVCNDCGAEYSKWQGQCSACQAWNTLSEVRIPGSSGGEAREARFSGYTGSLSSIQSLEDVDLTEESRIATGIGELDRVLGGGLVAGSAVLLGGHPRCRQEHTPAADAV